MATILRRNLISVIEGPWDYFANTQALPLLGRRWISRAFGALGFAHLAPGSTVIAFNPQTTLDQSIAPWERRFWKGMKQD